MKMLTYLLTVLVISNGFAEGQNNPPFTSPVFLRNTTSKTLSFAGKTYYFENALQANFYNAFLYCRQMKMHLLSIDNQIENDRIGKFVYENGLISGHFWTSAAKIPDNRWVWLSTGRDMVYTNWHPGEPNYEFFETCMEVRHEGRSGFTWNNRQCLNEMLFICERPLDCQC